jgi:putative sulfotransferase
LQQRFGKQTWVERSGGTLRIIRRLHKAFPRAKFLHIVRDGRNCAISMSKHYGFRMVLLLYQLMEVLGVDPYTSSDRKWAQDLSDELYALLPENFGKTAFENYEVHTSLCGHYWSGEVIAGLEELRALPSTQVCTLRYEDFLAQPEPTLQAFMEFLGPQYVNEEWMRRAKAQIGRGRSAWTSLPAREQTLLQEACRPGFEALRAHGISTDFQT